MAWDRFDTLSAGTQEHVGIAIRLGMARILAGSGTLPVLLDDALVATDERGFDRMAAVLQDAARKLQLIVLTCHWERYRLLGVDRAQVIDLDGSGRAIP